VWLLFLPVLHTVHILGLEDYIQELLKLQNSGILFAAGCFVAVTERTMLVSCLRKYINFMADAHNCRATMKVFIMKS
jgi:hypothetical protein